MGTTNIPNSKSANPKLLEGEWRELLGPDRWKKLFDPVDISSLVIYRMMFGLIMIVEVIRYFNNGWIHRYWVRPEHHLTYFPFDFLAPLPEYWMYFLFYAMGVLSIFIILGLFYRFSIITFFFCFSYIFLLEQTRYLNHFYLIVLLSFVMMFLPLHKSASLDSVLFKNNRSETAPAWTLWLMRFMVGVPYFFGGIAKINWDWLRGQPLTIWLADAMDVPVIGQYFDEHWMILFMSYSGLLLDLLVVPLLLFKRTRIPGYLFILLFHLLNTQMFHIGIFPWFMIAATTIYFTPSWPRTITNWIFSGAKPWKFIAPTKAQFGSLGAYTKPQKWTLGLLAFWVALHCLLPFRHHLYPGDVNWTEEGHRFSWHMKLRTKSGRGDFRVHDKNSGVTYRVDPRDYLRSWQRRKMRCRPYQIWQFAQILKEDFGSRGMDVAVYADIEASLNGRDFQPLVNPNVDLSAEPRPIFRRSHWIVPLYQPFRY